MIRAVAVALLVTSGCSWIAVDAPPRRPAVGARIECARSHWATGGDLATFGLLMLGGVAQLGFVEVGTMRDRFRVDGRVIDDVAMTLAL